MLTDARFMEVQEGWWRSAANGMIRIADMHIDYLRNSIKLIERTYSQKPAPELLAVLAKRDIDEAFAGRVDLGMALHKIASRAMRKPYIGQVYPKHKELVAELQRRVNSLQHDLPLRMPVEKKVAIVLDAAALVLIEQRLGKEVLASLPIKFKRKVRTVKQFRVRKKAKRKSRR